MLALSDFMRCDMSVFGLIESNTLFTLRVIDTFFFFPVRVYHDKRLQFEEKSDRTKAWNVETSNDKDCVIKTLIIYIVQFEKYHVIIY